MYQMLDNAMSFFVTALFSAKATSAKAITLLRRMDSHRPALTCRPVSHAVLFVEQERQHG